ncbi:hypothetical protein CAEBREN_13271 [Caenorhabditis brenneri]|uniref:Uncharacterized protein n=1 Tax=Caenorhabditis brenneri TaxID=135651 RepID=G0NIV1_CAEBE|nr:hypothetical protein CAEBREN_13271 [Caenorhabditis brenneri]
MTYQILEDAFDMKMVNVISYCDWYYAQTKTWEGLKGNGNSWILNAIEFNLRHFLASILRSMTSLKEFVSVEDVEEMSNESMKMFVAKFFDQKF